MIPLISLEDPPIDSETSIGVPPLDDKIHMYHGEYIYIYVCGPFIDGLPMKNGDNIYIYTVYGWWLSLPL